MIGERRYGGDYRGRSLSPRQPPPRSRDVNPPRHWKVSPNRRHGTEEYSREANGSRWIEKRDRFDARVPRVSSFDDRERDRLGGRRFRSPRRNEEKVNFDRPVSMSSYGDGAGRYDSEISVVRPGRSYNDNSYHGDGATGKYVNEISVMQPERSYDEYLYRGDLSSLKKLDHPLDGSQKSDPLSMKHYSSTCGYSGVDDINASSSGDRDYYIRKSYLDNSQDGLPASRYLDSTKPASLKYESAGSLHSYSYSLARGRVDDIHARNSSRGDGISHTSYVASASQYLNTETDKDRYISVRDELHLERNDGLHNRESNYFEKKSNDFQSQDWYIGVGKSVESGTYKFKKEKSILSSRDYLKGNSDYSESSSHIKDYDPVPSGILREGFSSYSHSRELHMPSSDATHCGSGVSSQQISYDGYNEKKQNMLSSEPEAQFEDTRSRSRLYFGLPEKRKKDWSYAEFGRSTIDGNNFEEDYRDPHLLRTEVLKPSIGVRSHQERMWDDELRDQYPSFQVQSIPDKFDLHGSLYDRRRDGDILGAGSTHLNHGVDRYYGYGGVKTEKHHADIDGSQYHSENSDPSQSRGYGPTFGRIDNSPRKRLPVTDLSLVEPYERRRGDKLIGDDTLIEHDVGIRISVDGNGARRIYNHEYLDDEIDLGNLSKKSKPSRPESHDYENTFGVSSELEINEPSSSEFHPRYSIKPHKSGFRDITRRLGPIQKLHVSQRLVKVHKPSIKNRLAPAPPKRHATLPWIKNMSSSKITSDQNDPHEGFQDHEDGDSLADHIPLATPEPPEKSKEFKQLVQNAFFKFLKQINETPTKRKTYTEQGKSCILKCFVCGSNSEEFIGTESLAMHAFTSMIVGIRSQHLGLHKALCALMGWKVSEYPSSEWHCQAMTNAEARILKEDLIIWPPVVVVHKTIDSPSSGEPVSISADKLDTKLKDMGFGNILKVCNGKAANQSVMVVKFKGTLSGLQEAERFHQSYIKSKHGRAEFKKFKFESGKGGSKVKTSDRDDDFLYAYLGIAEDLNKLDPDTKKRCVLRSKKQILGIVDALMDTEGETGS